MRRDMKPVIDPEFQSLIPPPTAKELAGLETSILELGCRDALVVWQERGILLDGHNRLAICEAHSVPFKIHKSSFPDRTAAKIWMIKNQVGRRNLSITQRSLCAAKLETLDHGGNRKFKNGIPFLKREGVCELFGVSKDTVTCASKVLAHGCDELIAACQEDRIAVSAGAEIADLEHDEQRKLVGADAPTFARVVKEQKRAKKKKRVADRAKKKAAAVTESHPLDGKAFRLFVADIRRPVPEIEDRSIDAIITDPPYMEEYLPLYADLANLAARVLVPGGSLLVMTGQAHLPKVIELLCVQGLTYGWTLCYSTPGASVQVHGRKVRSNWKPVLWFVKGKWSGEYVNDVLDSDSQENAKDYHEWGQSVGGMAAIIEAFSVESDTILDPFLGAGSTAIAAVNAGRLFVGFDIDGSIVALAAKRMASIV